MSIYMQLVALFLPLIALANPVIPRELITKSFNYGNSTTSWTSTPSWDSSSSSLRILADQAPKSSKGDTLGITRCYCASPTWGADNVFGYYYLWDYYNYHTNHRFLLERVCHSSAMTRSGILGSEAYQIMCLRPMYQHRECMTRTDPAHKNHKDKFCYILNGKEHLDMFTYNGQTRGLPQNSPGEKHASEAKVAETCEKLCHSDKVGGLEMLKGIALAHANSVTPDQDRFMVRDNEWSHISFYPEIDDMCDGCA